MIYLRKWAASVRMVGTLGTKILHDWPLDWSYQNRVINIPRLTLMAPLTPTFFLHFHSPRRCCCEQKVKAQGENVTSIPSLICYAFRAFHWFVNAANVKESFVDSTNSKMIFYRKKIPKSHATFTSYNKRIASWRDSWFLILIPKWQHTNKQN